MSEMNVESLESSLGAAFGDAPPPAAPAAPAAPAPAAKAPVPASEEPPFVLEEDPADLLQTDPEPIEAAPGPEPTFEIDLDGKPETITGADRVKELLTRGLKAGRGFEENARVREALQAHVQQAQFQQQFQQAVSADIVQLQALDNQLQAFDRVDWASLYDTNFQEAFKLKEQRDQLREHRAAAFQSLNAKQQQFQAHMQQTAQQALAAESQALLAKVPTWRNPEKAAQARSEITNALATHYGFTPQEISAVMDHRMILVARDAAAYRQLLANKDSRLKQAREAPAVAKPGAAPAQQNGRVEFTKVRGKIRELGSKGNHKAQEQLATQLFERAFK